MSDAGPREMASLQAARELPPHAVADVFARLRRAERRTTRDGRPYYELRLADAGSEVDGRIWSDRQEAMQAIAAMPSGALVKVRFEVDVYQDVVQLKVLRLRPLQDDERERALPRIQGDMPDWLRPLCCETLVLDIETVPDRGIREMPPTIVKTLTEHAQRTERDEGAVRALSPYFGKVVSLAFGDGQRVGGDGDGAAGIHVLAVPRDEDRLDDHPDWLHPVTEPELLRCFWQLAACADLVVTFNGRHFDVPFLVGRSLVHGIPARVDLLGTPRWALRPHLDLLDVVGQRGRGPSNLDVVCWALGIDSPKGAMDGSLVAPAYDGGRLVEIAGYNRQDVRATAAVYRRARDLVLRQRPELP